jgi:hypothetical protein
MVVLKHLSGRGVEARKQDVKFPELGHVRRKRRVKVSPLTGNILLVDPYIQRLSNAWSKVAALSYH